MVKEQWTLVPSVIFDAFSNFSLATDVDRIGYVGVLFGAQFKIEICVFLDDAHLKQQFFEFVTNAVPSDLSFVGVLIIPEHEPNVDISYMGPGIEISVPLGDLIAQNPRAVLAGNLLLKEGPSITEGATLVSKVMFEAVLRRGCEESDLKNAVEKFASTTGELVYHHKDSGLVLQANTHIQKVLDEHLRGARIDRDFLRFISYRRISAVEEGNGEDQKHVPVLKVHNGEIVCNRLSVPLWITCAAYLGESSNQIYLRWEESVRRTAYNLLYVMLKGIKKTATLSTVEARCFWPASFPRILSIITPHWAESEQKAWRLEQQRLFNLSIRVPALRRLQAIDFERTARLLRSPHLAIGHYKPAGRISVVKGAYDYHHYMQNGLDDSGWGCAYRSLQTIWSWFILNGFSDKPVPMHREIQEALVRIEGDLRSKNFVGSRQWIGSFEIGYVLSDAMGVDCAYIAQFADISEKARELQVHFDTIGSPVMIGGNQLAHTILGVDFCENTGEARFLVLDPHYTGGEDIHTVTTKGWCAWKQPSFWKTGLDISGSPIVYNIVKPQIPPNSV